MRISLAFSPANTALLQIQTWSSGCPSNLLITGWNVALFEVAFFDDRGHLYLPEVSKRQESRKVDAFIW